MSFALFHLDGLDRCAYERYGAGSVVPPVAATVMITLGLLTVVAAALATAVAFTAAAAGLDAAIVAPPATTTLIDTVGLLLYFHIAACVHEFYGDGDL